MAKNNSQGGGGGGGTSPAITGGSAAASIQVGVYFSEEVMIDIMSRLPVKSLMRFKCLSKRWLYLIRQDKQLISLHFSRSESSQELLITSHSCNHGSSEFFTLDLSKRRVDRMPNTRKAADAKEPMFGLVNGLLFFVNKINNSVCIRNICTREETPWITPNITKEYFSTFGLGFDPVTQKHKVVYLCSKPGTYDPYCDRDELNCELLLNCEVLIVGESYWRTKEDVALPKYLLEIEPIYSNGSLYWCVQRPTFLRPEKKKLIEYIVVFDVGKEKFRRIKYPDIVNKDPNGFVGNDYSDYLSEGRFLLQGLDGRLILMDKWYYDGENKVIKMEIWMIDDDRENNTSSWIGEKICLPLNWEKDLIWSFASITDFLVILCDYFEESGDYGNWHKEIYLYDMKKKKVIEFGRLLSLSQLSEFFVFPFMPRLSVLRSSIYPVCAPL